MSTVFSYTNPIIQNMDKKILFALVKREGDEVRFSNEFEDYKKAVLSAINGVSVEFIDENMKDVRGDDAVCEVFYNLVIKFFVQHQIDVERFVAIMQNLWNVKYYGSTLEYRRECAILKIPFTYGKSGFEVMRVVLEKLLPRNPQYIFREWVRCNDYLPLLAEYNPDWVKEGIEFNNGYEAFHQKKEDEKEYQEDF